jgi:hypothetical protein
MKALLVVRIVIVAASLSVSEWYIREQQRDLDWKVTGLVRLGLVLGAVLSIQGSPDSRLSRHLQTVGLTLSLWIPCFVLVYLGTWLFGLYLPHGTDFIRLSIVVSSVASLVFGVFLTGWALPRLERTLVAPGGAGPAGPGPPTEGER